MARRSQSQFDDEIDAHIALLAERFRSRGMSADDALAAARRQFGNRTSLKETRRDMTTVVWLETLWQDLRHGARVLRKNKSFAAVAILTLALGIGANTAIFSVVNAALLRPLPYPDPSRLTILWGNVRRAQIERRGASYPDYIDWRGQSHSFEAMAAFDDRRITLAGMPEPEVIIGEYVSQPYFDLLGIHPALGRTFRPDEDVAPGRDAVALIGDGMWKRRFGADPAVIGWPIQLNGAAYTIIGVAPPGFKGLSDDAEVWAPFVMSGSAEDLNERGNRGFRVLARLKATSSPAQAQTELDAISRRLERTYPATNAARGVELIGLDQEIVGDLRKPLLVLLAAVGFVMLIASTNVANLLLARSETRTAEVAMRAALGASWRRLLRQLLAENTVLVVLGGAIGLLLARFGIQALMAASPIQFPSTLHPSIDWQVCLFVGAVCCAVALALGIAPAIQSAARPDALQQSSHRSTAGRRSFRVRDLLVISEVALSLVLLVGAGLMIRSLQRLSAINPGYDPEHLINFRVGLPRLQPGSSPAANQPDAKVAVVASEILRQIGALPGVESASMATDAPLNSGGAIFYTAEGQPPVTARNMPRAYPHRASPGFFRTLRTRFIAGRTFSDDEVHNRANVAIVTSNLVNRFWSGQDPIGKRIKMGELSSQDPWLTIIGVLEDMKYRGLPRNPTADPDLFLPFNERSRDFAVLVRTRTDPSSMLQSVRSTLRQAQSSILIYNSGALEESVAAETASPRFTGWLLAIFAAIALVLAMIGIYGVMAYTVSRRTREIGLRMALGAGRGDVRQMVIRRGVTLVAIGVAAGAAASLALARIMTTLVYDVSSTDPLTYAAATAVLVAAALAGCLLPASRASRIDPAIALRNE